MARMARSVCEGHVTQRGNGRARTFSGDGDDRLYRDLLAENAAKAGVEVWGWPNPVHLVLVPSGPDGLRRCLAPAHRRYAGAIHAREQRTGHFWQGRFGCAAMDEALSLRLRRAEIIGRPVGDAAFLSDLEARCGRPLAAPKRGRRPKADALSPQLGDA